MDESQFKNSIKINQRQLELLMQVPPHQNSTRNHLEQILNIRSAKDINIYNNSFILNSGALL